jgi:hypothetical protein
MARKTGSLPLTDPYPKPTHRALSIVGGTNGESAPTSNVSFEDGAIKIDNEDGTTTIDFSGEPQTDDGPEDTDFDKNLAKNMDDGELSSIATSLEEGIEQDILSRKEWIDTREQGIALLGLKLEKARSDAGTSSAPLEGMAVVRHPLLLEATVSFQATARAELLPASGPVKVRNDAPTPPKSVSQDTSATHDLADSMDNKDDLSQALEKDMNHYLTAVATEYVPDTDRMLFYVGFGGDGFKKVYNCPLRRRPVSESIDAEDLIVSNAATDLYNSTRVTHRIKMRKSTLRRMQILGVYRDVDIGVPNPPAPDAVDKKKQELSGQKDTIKRPEDREYTIYECYCELDLDEFAPKQFKGKGLPLPYRVTIEHDSRKILDIRRNWKEEDEQCLAKRFFVQFPFIRGLGFYGLGYIHLLGNTTSALTAAWRLMLDSGMFANFPGFLYAKGAGRQNTNTFRIAPGTGQGLDVGAQQSIKDAIMPLPYKEVGPSFTAFTTHIEEVGRRLASTASANVGEGKQDAPVGTTLALIEQASKVMDSAHKRLHAAQAEEFKLLKERFREDPEAFWRHDKKQTIEWKKDQFIQALNSCELVPVADPNNPTSLHRIAKAMAIKTLQQASPQLYDPQAVDMRIMRIVDIDPEGLFRPTPAEPPPDPRFQAIQAKQQQAQQQAQIQQMEAQIKAATAQATFADKAQERQSRERIEAMKLQLADMRLKQEAVIHAHDLQQSTVESQQQMQMDRAQKIQELQHDHIARMSELQGDQIEQQHEMRGGVVKTAMELQMEHERHQAEMRRADESHRMSMQHAQELHEQKLESAKQLAKVKKPKAKE